MDPGHRDTCVRHDDVFRVDDDPGGGGVASAVLSRVSAQPLVKDGLAAVEMLAVVLARVQQYRPAKLNQAS